MSESPETQRWSLQDRYPSPASPLALPNHFLTSSKSTPARKMPNDTSLMHIWHGAFLLITTYPTSMATTNPPQNVFMTNTMNTMKQSISLDQAQIKLLVDHLHEISDPEPGLLEILSILEPILEVSTKFIGCLKF